MKFYIASNLKNHELVNYYAKKLEEKNWEQTYDWTQNITKEINFDVLKEIAKQEQQGIIDSDIVIILLPAGRGGYVELGMAMALNKMVFLCSPTTDDFKIENTVAFYELETTNKLIGTPDENIEKILTLSKRKGDKNELR